MLGEPESEPMEVEETKRQERKRKASVETMRTPKVHRLNVNTMVRRMPPLDTEWPAFPSGRQANLTSRRHFAHGAQDYRPDRITAMHFAELTITQIAAFGGGNETSYEIAELVLQQTIRHLTAYLNIMYRNAMDENRSVIMHQDVFSVIPMNSEICRNFCLHFLPDPTVSADQQHLQITKILLNKYQTDKNFLSLYNNSQLMKMSLERARIMKANIQHFSGSEDPALQSVSFVQGKSRASERFAHHFHDLLGKPPLEEDMILVVAFLAKMCISEIVRKAINAAGVNVQPKIEHYRQDLDNPKDLLFNLVIGPFNPSREVTPIRIPSIAGQVHGHPLPEFYNVRVMQEETKAYRDQIVSDRKGVPVQKGYAWRYIKAK